MQYSTWAVPIAKCKLLQIWNVSIVQKFVYIYKYFWQNTRRKLGESQRFQSCKRRRWSLYMFSVFRIDVRVYRNNNWGFVNLYTFSKVNAVPSLYVHYKYSNTAQRAFTDKNRSGNEYTVLYIRSTRISEWWMSPLCRVRKGASKQQTGGGHHEE